jgi:hypothetical protein
MPRDIFVFWQSPQPLSVSGDLAVDLADSFPMAYSEDGTPLCFRQSPDDVPDHFQADRMPDIDEDRPLFPRK